MKINIWFLIKEDPVQSTLTGQCKSSSMLFANNMEANGLKKH